MEKIRKIFGYPDSLYNCSGKTSEEWLETGEKRPLIGLLFGLTGAVFIMLYMPSIYAICKLKLMRNVCYKIMFCLIFTDLGNLSANSLMAAYMFSMGAVFCWDPVFMYIEGAYNIFMWGMASFLYVVLAVNRLFVIIDNPRLIRGFTAVPIGVWVIFAICWGFLVGVIGKPMPYNSKAIIAVVLPYIEDTSKEAVMYASYIHILNNSLFAGLIFIIYASIAIILLYTRHKGNLKISKAEMNALLQAALITTPAIIGGYFYVIAQFTNKDSHWISVTGQVLWTLFTGMSSIIYLTLNSSVRNFYFGGRVYAHQDESSTKDRTTRSSNI